MNKFFIVRHGETLWNLEHKFQGSLNSNLTETGRNQAENLAKTLINKKIDYIYTSNLGRAIETTNIISEIIQKPFEIVEDLKEMSFGVWEGMNIESIKANYEDEFKIWQKNPYGLNIPGIEDMNNVQVRMNREIENINDKHTDSNILVVSHGMTIKILMAKYLDMSLESIGKFSQDNTALNIIEFTPNGALVKRLNDTNHLEV